MAVNSTDFLLTSILVIFIVAIVKWTQSRGRKFLDMVPGPRRLPFLGNYKDFLVPHEELVRKSIGVWSYAYGKRYVISGVFARMMVTRDLLDAEKVLSSSVQIKKGIQYRFLLPWIGEGLLLATGAKWMQHRKLLTPSFHFKILEEFIPCFNRQSKTLVEILGDEGANRKTINILPYMSLCTLDIVCESVMGRRINAQRERTSTYVQAVYGYASLVPYRIVRPWLLPDLFWAISPAGRRAQKYLRTLHDFTEGVIRERKSEILRKPSVSEGNEIAMRKKPIAFLDLLLQIQKENPGEFPDSYIREETDTFMFEGHDTTATSLSWTIWLLSLYPKHQQRVIEELDSIFGSDKERDVTQEDMSKMKYLECCIKESLRLYPSVPFISRELTTDLELHDGLVVPEGITIGMIPYVIHRNAEIFPDPEVFDPERFLSANANGRNPYAYVPFSAGPRNCIGQKFAVMEEKIILAHLLRNFRVEAVTKEDEVVIMMELIIRSKNGLNIQLIPRNG